jgi:two-component system chemotaxis response regulator CheY
MPKALIVDDQLVMRRMFGTILEPEGFDITMAVDGSDGWIKAKIADFDLIITDYHMPHMNGVELCLKLRESTRHKFTPILIVSTESNTSKKQEGRDAGASGWIVKPIKAEILLPALKRLM